MNQELIKSLIGTAFRNLVTPLVVWLTAKGWVTADDANALTLAIVAGAGALIWGLWQKWQASKALSKALALPSGTSIRQLNEELKRN